MRSKKEQKQNKEIVVEHEGNDSSAYSVAEFEQSVDTSFFYTSDKTLESSDYDEVFKKIQMKYPDFTQNSKDTVLKKTFLDMLDNKTFMVDILDYFHMTIHDFFKVVYKHYGSLFNALFIKKVKDKLSHVEYN